MSSAETEFVRFATVVAPRLRRTAYLLCHDWHFAQDLTQTALSKSYVSWRKVSRSGNPESYCRAILMRVFLDHQREIGACQRARGLAEGVHVGAGRTLEVAGHQRGGGNQAQTS